MRSPRPGVAVDRLVDGALRAIRCPPRKGEVAALQGSGPAMVGELGGERTVGAVVLGDHHQPGGVLVEAVDDAGAPHPTDAGKALPAMGDQRVDERAGAVSRGGMDDETARLVDDDDVVVLVDDVGAGLPPGPGSCEAPAGGSATAISSPALTWWLGSRIVRPLTVTCPARIKALRRGSARSSAKCARRARGRAARRPPPRRSPSRPFPPFPLSPVLLVPTLLPLGS